ncbi:MAG: hypothetical protein KGH87_08050 [Thaumarchaeota archaeon]|nr:hypothetical protein [Nitrososphaerota archaeon]
MDGVTSWHSYPSPYALGHRNIADLLLDPVLVEEKVDGSQLSFGVFLQEGGRVLRVKSKSAELNILAPEKMFRAAVEYIQSIQDKLILGWTYRGEYLAKPKHNVLAYDRIPKNHIILFDINVGHEQYVSHDMKSVEAERLGFEVVPRLHQGMIHTPQQFREMLDRVSILGGQKIEGVVVKNYVRFGIDKKILIGKFVSGAFKEVHKREWKAENPGKMDVVQQLIESLKTPARWNKAIQHLREAGQIQDNPKDTGLLMREVPQDIEKEEVNFIKDRLFTWAWPHIRRGVTSGLPEWYKQKLMETQSREDTKVE